MTKYNRPIVVTFTKLQSKTTCIDSLGGGLVAFASLVMQSTSARPVCVSAHRAALGPGNGRGAYLGWWRFYGAHRGEA